MPGNLPCMSGKPDHSPEEGALGHDIYPVICLPRRHPKGKDLDDIESQPVAPLGHLHVPGTLAAMYYYRSGSCYWASGGDGVWSRPTG